MSHTLAAVGDVVGVYTRVFVQPAAAHVATSVWKSARSAGLLDSITSTLPSHDSFAGVLESLNADSGAFSARSPLLRGYVCATNTLFLRMMRVASLAGLYHLSQPACDGHGLVPGE